MDASATVDATGTVCPIPIIRAAERIGTIPVGEVLEVLATDEAILDDLPAWCRATGHAFLGIETDSAHPEPVEGRDSTSSPQAVVYRGYVRRTR